MADYDLLGNIALIKSEYDNKKKTRADKLKQAGQLFKQHSVTTVLEKAGDVKGRLRTIRPKYVAGEKTFIANYRENGCQFKFDTRTCYFSPRLSNDRKIIAEKIKKNERILVMFSGVGVYPIVIYKNSKPKEIVAVELGKECCKYAEENLKLNKIPKEKIKIIQGDVKKKVNKSLGKFDIIMMARPNLKPSFLEYALKVSKKGTGIFYHLFCKDENLNDEIEKLVLEAKALKRTIKIKEKVFAGEIAPYKHRYRIEMIVLN
jgi:tRNA (guanine37-N1)-methyltransferase